MIEPNKFLSLSPNAVEPYLSSGLPYLLYEHPVIIVYIGLHCSAFLSRFDYSLDCNFDYYLLNKCFSEQEIEHFVAVFKREIDSPDGGSSIDAYLFKIKDCIEPLIPNNRKLTHLNAYVNNLENCSQKNDLDSLHRVFGFCNNDIQTEEYLHGYNYSSDINKKEMHRYLTNLNQELSIKCSRSLIYRCDGLLQKDIHEDIETISRNWSSYNQLRSVGVDTSHHYSLILGRGGIGLV